MATRRIPSNSEPRLVRALVFCLAALVALASGCSEFRPAPTGVRVGARHPVPGEPLRGRAAAAPALELLDRHESGLFNLGAAEVVDFHPPSRQVFVVSAKAARVTVLRLGARGFERGERALEPRRDITGFSAGDVTSLAIAGDLVAVAVCAGRNDRRGRVAFYAASGLEYLGAVTVGHVPDMLTFTPDGRTLLVANEGEQIRNGEHRIVSDPEGGVSIIDLSLGVSRASVVDATFEAFDARIEEYRNAGVRVPRLGDRFFESGEGAVSLSRDLEPEYIAVSPDGKTAWVSLQENDAVAVLDVEARAFADILPLGVKDFSVGLPVVERLSLPDELALPDHPARPGARAPSSGRLVRVAARSAQPEPALQPTGFWFDAQESRASRKVFYVVRGDAIERLELRNGGLERSGELVPLEPPSGAGFRGLVRDPSDQSFWLGSARGGVLYHVSSAGRLLHALPIERVRGGSGGAAPEPATRSPRQPGVPGEGRAEPIDGAEEPSIIALALDASRRRLYALLEAGRAASASGAPSRLVRVLELDVDPHGAGFGVGLGEYLYMSDAGAASDAGYRVTAAAFAGNDRLLVLEQGGSAAGSRSGGALRVFRADLTGASDVRGLATGKNEPLEDCAADALYAGYGLKVAHKQRLLSLPGQRGSGLPPFAPGIGLLGDSAIAILHGGGLTGGSAGAADGLGAARLDGPALELLSFDDQNRLDASDRDGKAELRHWPVLGGYMPDGIEAMRVAGRDYFVTANEGDTRQYDSKRLADAELDPRRFPEAAALQSSATLGRLKISALEGDLDGDGDLDEIHAFGARSVSIWDAGGDLVADTGSLFEDVTAQALAGAFNSNNDENGTFDTRSDDKGPEPEGLEVAEIDGRIYAFVGLERVGGIVVLDLTDPHGAQFVEYVNPRDFSGSAAQGSARDLGPEGLRFVPARQSPTGRGLLLVANEVSGTTSVYDVNL